MNTEEMTQAMLNIAYGNQSLEAFHACMGVIDLIMRSTPEVREYGVSALRASAQSFENMDSVLSEDFEPEGKIIKFPPPAIYEDDEDVG